MQDTNEIWKPIAEFTEYEVSNLGRVRTVKTSRIKTQPIHWKGYPVVTLRKPIQICRTFRTHRLVAAAFIPNLNNYPQVNHKNGIKTDNRVENLEWCNNSMNQQHSVDTGLRVMPTGLNTKKAVLVLDPAYGIYYTVSEAASVLGMNDTTLARHLRSGKSKYILA